jgi:hypothetical protein
LKYKGLGEKSSARVEPHPAVQIRASIFLDVAAHRIYCQRSIEV